MPNRTDLLNFLIQKHNLKSYCELGTQIRAINFDKVICDRKICVDIDPNAKADYTGSTDDFFKMLPIGADHTGQYLGIPVYYDLFFIDASHHAEDVKRDFENALNHLSQGGIICLHDCNPLKEEHTIVPRPTERGHWNGDVYKFACELGLYSRKFNVVDIDNGCGVWNWVGMDIQKDSDGWWPETWENFDRNRKELLNLISWDEFVKIH